MYSDFILEYATLQHSKLVPDLSSEPVPAYYLPHHGVVKETSITTKLRVVFNGSSKTSTGVSLNDLLHVGPKLQNELFDVLIWYRQFRYVFSSDIEKMYRQIKIHPDDWKFQRILWIDQNGHVLTYQLTTVTYGLACAPFQALRVMLQQIKDGDKFPLAIPILKHSRYVDDLFGGGDSIEQAQVTLQQVNQLCMAGEFRLHKWISNYPDVLNSIPESDQITGSIIPIEENSTVLSLGLSWHPTTDTFRFIHHPTQTETVTKRIILSTIARLFDPLGFLSPIIIRAKILMQEVWTLRLDWDDAVPATTTNRWLSLVNDLQNLSTLSFPRWIGLSSNQLLEIHGFSDASPHAYAAVVYSRLTSANGEVSTRLICSKTKVTPLKRMTIPRLELAGAALLAKLVKHILQILDQRPASVYLWTDSTVTLTWISNHPSRWKDFIHNRVCFIQESVPQARWNFFAGPENPADLATRGLSVKQLSEQELWWNGSIWLRESPQHWPERPINKESGKILDERPVKVAITCAYQTEDWDLISRYSNLTRLLRITALCRRAINRFRKVPNSSMTNPITTVELQSAKQFWVKAVQRSVFAQELRLISSGEPFPTSHPLSRLTPFKDASSILRVGGRLRESSLSIEAKHPAILPRHSPLSTLIIADSHRRT
ncbi:PREDICTED: uncharacterized protein LOC108758300 [Trachymyrmex cornetzi]|uniref:uncharacterized protein LOC108758300 n=1 Tax=Trachymyrmex cornetzi TaxID=471704 RepID=UPI00084EF6DE|nr:PREDICTED: uncharacterized protein LOC108758300 [Trachymyrmex cornetzi]